MPSGRNTYCAAIGPTIAGIGPPGLRSAEEDHPLRIGRVTHLFIFGRRVW